MGRQYLIYVVVVSALGGFLFGFDSAVISGGEEAIEAQYQVFYAQPDNPKATEIIVKDPQKNPKSEYVIDKYINGSDTKSKLLYEKTIEEKDPLSGTNSTRTVTAIRTSYTPFWHGFTMSIALVGTIIGAFCIGRPSDMMGRRRSLMLMAIMYLISAAGCAFAANWETLVGMRFLGGLAIGGSSVIVPLYIVELAPGNIRGRLVAVNQLNIVIGILVSYISNYWAANAIDNQTVIWTWCTDIANWFVTVPMVSSEIKWRLMLGIECLPAILFAILLLSIPESPRWLVRKKRSNEALDVLKNIGDQDAEKTVEDIQQSLKITEAGDNIPLFQPKYFKLIFLAWAVAMFNQLSGINAINYYAPRIFGMFGIGESSALGATIIVGSVNLTFTILAFFFIDWFGRRSLLMIGALGTTAMHFLVAWQLSLGNGANSILAIGGILGFIAFFAVSQGAVIWVFISEIFPNAVRAKGQALGSFTHWFMCTIISFLFPIVAASAGEYAFGFFGCMTMLQFFFALFIMPETKGGTIEAMEQRLAGKSQAA